MRRLALLAGLAAFAALQAAAAHDARPVALAIEETATQVYTVSLRVPPSVERDNLPSLRLPTGCSVAGNGGAGVAPGRKALLHCRNSLDGSTLHLDWPLYNPSLSTVLHYTPQGQAPRFSVFAPTADGITLSTTPRWRDVVLSYLRSGISHIWSGYDHLLFVAGLLLLARTPRRILLGVTGFTLAHSVTLSLAALGIVSPPVEPTEAAIALSIVFLARELTLARQDTLAWRHPALVASSFGLLHGFGFAAALQENGLPRDHVATALLGFNLGVEIGQLLFIVAVIGLLRVAQRLTPAAVPDPARATSLGGYAVGTLSLYWLLERLQGL
jgi:hydrogenase/urease accessory protein HupE